MAIIRSRHNKDNPYVTLNKKTLELEDLSWEAKGLWSYLMSRPDNWHTNTSHLTKNFAGGRDRVRRILRELEEAGLLHKIQTKGERGHFEKVDYDVFETPQKLKKCLPRTENPSPENAAPENPSHNKERVILSNDSKEKDLLRRSKVVAAAPPPKVSFGEFKRVKLTQADLNDLVERFGKEKINATIDAVDSWCEENGKTKKNYKLTILNWIKREPQFNPQAKKEEIQQKNRQLASEIKKKLEQAGVQRKIRFDLCSTCLELGSYDHPHVKAIPFNENGFRDQLEGFLRKTNLFSLINV